jgi:hypothetical protein
LSNTAPGASTASFAVTRSAAGCADDATSDGTDNKARPAKANLEQFLMQAGEEPGFMPIESPRVDLLGESSGLPPAGLARLDWAGPAWQSHWSRLLGATLSTGAKAIYERTNGVCPT